MQAYLYILFSFYCESVPKKRLRYSKIWEIARLFVPLDLKKHLYHDPT